MSYQLGIDLGTTYTAAAVYRDGRATICSLGGRAASIPSVVLLREDGEVLTGEAAVRRAITEPERVAREFKRRLGDSTPIIVGGTPYSAEALSARLLRSVVDQVTEREGSPPASIVLCHPANWGQFKIDLLQQAVRLAGLDPSTVSFLTEPEAAAISYAAQERVDPGEVVAVYDLGGGTFDAAVLRRTPSGFEIIGAPEGIERLGGIDFDAAVFAHVSRSLDGAIQQLDQDDVTAVAGVSRLRADCVEAKEALSSDTDATIPVLLPNVQTDVRITRREFESIIRPSLVDSIEAMRRALRSAGVEPADVSRVLLVGGSSRVPLIAQLVSSELGRPVAVDAHPKHAIALGAAFAAGGALATVEPGPATVIDAAPPPQAAPPVAAAAPPMPETAASTTNGASSPPVDEPSIDLTAEPNTEQAIAAEAGLETVIAPATVEPPSQSAPAPAPPTPAAAPTPEPPKPAPTPVPPSQTAPAPTPAPAPPATPSAPEPPTPSTSPGQTPPPERLVASTRDNPRPAPTPAPQPAASTRTPMPEQTKEIAGSAPAVSDDGGGKSRGLLIGALVGVVALVAIVGGLILNSGGDEGGDTDAAADVTTTVAAETTTTAAPVDETTTTAAPEETTTEAIIDEGAVQAEVDGVIQSFVVAGNATDLSATVAAGTATVTGTPFDETVQADVLSAVGDVEGVDDVVDQQVPLAVEFRCTEEIMSLPRWVCITDVQLDDTNITAELISSETEWNVSGGFHFHVFGSNIEVVTAGVANGISEGGGSWQVWDELTFTGSVSGVGSPDPSTEWLCARVATDGHGLDGLETGNCWPLTDPSS